MSSEDSGPDACHLASHIQPDRGNGRTWPDRGSGRTRPDCGSGLTRPDCGSGLTWPDRGSGTASVSDSKEAGP